MLHNSCCDFSARCVALEVIANGRLTGKCCNQATQVLVNSRGSSRVDADLAIHHQWITQMQLLLVWWILFPTVLVYFFLHSFIPYWEYSACDHDLPHGWPELTLSWSWVNLSWSSHQQLEVYMVEKDGQASVIKMVECVGFLHRLPWFAMWEQPSRCCWAFLARLAKKLTTHFL